MTPWIMFNTEIGGYEHRKLPGVDGDEELYEQVFVRKDKDPGWQSVFYLFPELHEWSTKDIYRKHPTLPDHWQHVGRTDDVIVFLNGEKLNPLSIEAAVETHPMVKGVVVVGAKRFQPAMIIEPLVAIEDKDVEVRDKLIEDIWPTVVKVNKETVAHGQIDKRAIHIGNIPFPRAGKGTILRTSTVHLYTDTIEALYKSLDAEMAREELVQIDVSSLEGITEGIKESFRRTRDAEFENNADFFASGVDSLQVITVGRILSSSLKATGKDVRVDPGAVYGHPSVNELAEYIFGAIRGNRVDQGPHQNRMEVRTMEELLEKYTSNYPPANNQAPPADQRQTVILTGSTGSLGSYLLDILITAPNVAKVVALNRDADGGRERQTQGNAERGLSTSFVKVEFLRADLSVPNMGLSAEKYQALLGEADRIIHNAWPVNFNMGVKSFEPSIAGVRQLVDFSAAANKAVPIIFLSSVASAQGWSEDRPVAEERLDDLSIAMGGYGQSKLVSSLILDDARERLGVPSASIRVGQIGGSRQEKARMWNKQEWLPSLVASSVYLGKLPGRIGPMDQIDWLPIEDITQLVTDIAGVTREVAIDSISGYYHGVNPDMVAWKTLAQAIREVYGDRIHETVTFQEWVAALEKSASDASMEKDIERNRGIKLLDTYRAMLGDQEAGRKQVVFAMERTPFRGNGPVNTELMKNWCLQWGF